VVAFFCKAFTQFRGHYSATTKRWVTNYTNFYVIHRDLVYKLQSRNPTKTGVAKSVLLLFRTTSGFKIGTFIGFTKIEYRLVDNILYPRTDIRLDKFVTPGGKHPI
jgi:hypothetical protein